MTEARVEVAVRAFPAAGAVPLNRGRPVGRLLIVAASAVLALLAWERHAAAADKVALQLRWDHQFQFAGYYAALWQGYFKEAGLEVEIRSALGPGGDRRNAVEEVGAGRADFGVGAGDILAGYDRGLPLVVLASIFQKSPVAIFARAKTQLATPSDLMSLRVGRWPNDDFIEAEMQAMLRAEGLHPDRLRRVDMSAEVSARFLAGDPNGEVDVVPGTGFSIPYRAKELGVDLREIRPESFGTHFYGDSLFTRERLVRDRPDLVERFSEASLRGWRYALDHPEEIARRITGELRQVNPPRDLLAYNLYQAGEVAKLALADVVPIGNVNPERWRRMHEELLRSGMVAGPLDLDAFVFDPARRAAQWQERLGRGLKLGVLALLALAAATFGWARALRRQVRRATADLRASEARYRLLAESTSDIIMLGSGIGGAPDYVSPACRAVLGYEPEHMAATATSELVHPDDLAKVTALCAGLGSDRRQVTSVHRLKHRDGRWVWVEVVFRLAAHGEPGRPRPVVASARDVTERKQVEDELDASRRRLAAVVAAAADGIIVIDGRGFVQAFNPAAERIFGYPVEEVVGRNVTMLMPEQHRPMHVAQLARTVATGQGKIAGFGRAIVVEGRRKDGTILDLELTIDRAKDPEAPLFVGVMRDVTERKAAEAALASARDEAEAAARAKSEFLASMSHEMRTPLTAVIGMSDLLADRPLGAEAAAYVEAIRRSGQQLLSIVNDVLDFTRAGAGQLSLHEDDFALAEVLEEVSATLRPLAEEKGLALEMAAPPGSRLRGDATRLRQILFNLVGNAIKFTERGRVQVGCQLLGRAAGALTLRGEVRDTGIGIAADQLGRLFTPFTQADGSASRRFGGAGLGLAISKQLVELMGGRIGCESTPGRGSRFWFEIELQRGARPAPPTGKPAWAEVPTLDILLAEDAPLNRQLLTDMLTRRGHRLTATEDGAEFLERARERPFDLLLVDIQMPVMDGEEAVRLVRRDEGPNRATPALALTANVMEDDRLRYLAAGFDTVLHKPVAWDRLFAEMARLTAAGTAPAASTAVGAREEGDVLPVGR